MDPSHAIIAVAIGLGAGFVGGLAGIGGSIIMLPALAIFFGYKTPEHHEHHSYMAAGMVVNVIVAFFSVRRHKQAGAVDFEARRVLLPSMLLAIALGVFASNTFGADWSRWALIVFIVAFAVFKIVSVLRKAPDHELSEGTHSRVLFALIGLATGLAAGFMGVGGGIILVPLLSIAGRLPLRRAIATSLGVIWITSALGATLKVLTLPAIGLPIVDAVVLAAFMGLGAIPGSRLGASLTHKLPLTPLRLTLAVILIAAAIRMAMNG